MKENKNDKTFIYEVTKACKRGDVDAVSALLDAGASACSTDSFNENLLSIFCSVVNYNSEDVEVLDFLIRRFPTLKTEYSIIFKAILGSFSLEENDESSEGPYTDPIKTSCQEIFEKYHLFGWSVPHTNLNFFLERGLTYAQLNQEGQTLLHLAAAYQQDEYHDITPLRSLLDRGYPCDLVNASQQTPLHYAIQKGYLPQALYLIYRQANLALKDQNGKTAHDYAQQFCLVYNEDVSDDENLECRADLLQVIENYS